jgi:hypothetical protein
MPNELTTVEFHGATLIAVRGETPAQTLVAMKPVVEGMGLDWKAQYDKIKEHPVLGKGMGLITIPSAGGPQAMTALPLNRLNFWLATIQPNRVPDPETRARVIRYQVECADVLFAHFFGQATGTTALVTMIAGLRTEIDAELSSQRRAMIELGEKVSGLILTADARRAAVELVSVKQLLDEAKCLQKGRRGINLRVGNALRESAMKEGLAGCRKCPHGGVWLFPVEFAHSFMKNSGNGWVRDHNDKHMGQGVIRFPDRRRKSEAETAAPETP